MKITSLCLLIFAFCLSVSAQEPERKNPAKACSYLSILNGLETNGWKQYHEGENGYGCSSHPLKLDDGFPLPNTIAYYVSGNEKTANEWKIVLNVNQPTKDQEAIRFFTTVCQILFKQSLGAKMPDEIANALSGHQSKRWENETIKVAFVKDVWVTGKGYSLKFTIR